MNTCAGLRYQVEREKNNNNDYTIINLFGGKIGHDGI